MFKLPIAAMIGLTAALSAAHADTIVIQGTPSFEPAIISHGPIAPFPVTHADGFNIFGNPAFHRMAEMCETLGFECGEDHATADGGIHPYWTPGHRADADKRLALLMADREDYAAALEEHFEALPVPRPHQLYGWNAPRNLPHPRALPHQFSNLFPLIPHTTLPRPTVPHTTLPYPVLPNFSGPQIQGFSGFNHRLNTPGAVIPHGLFPRHILPRHSFPWRSF